MRPPQSRTIGGIEYTATPLGAGVGLHVFARIARVIGPALYGVTSLDQLAALGLASLGDIATRLDGDTLEAICREFAKVTEVRIGSTRPQLSDVFDLHFAGNFGDLVEWLGLCIEVNYASFFTRAAEKVLEARLAASATKAAATSSSKSPPASSGPSIG